MIPSITSLSVTAIQNILGHLNRPFLILIASSKIAPLHGLLSRHAIQLYSQEFSQCHSSIRLSASHSQQRISSLLNSVDASQVFSSHLIPQLRLPSKIVFLDLLFSSSFFHGGYSTRGFATSMSTRGFTTSSTSRDYYQILGVSKNATEDEIKRNYRRLALLWHPDKHQSSPRDKQEEVEEKFKKIAEAYDVLGNAQKRKQYDTFRDFGASGFNSGNEGFRGFDQQPSSGRGFEGFTESHMSESEAREMFKRMFQDLFKGRTNQGSPFDAYNIEELLKNLGRPSSSTSSQQFTTIISRNGRLIQRTVITTRSSHGTHENVQEIDLGPAVQGGSNQGIQGGFSPFHKGMSSIPDIFTILEMVLRASERQYQQPYLQRNSTSTNRFESQHPLPQQLPTSNAPLARIARFVKKTWDSQPAREARFVIRLRLYDAAYRFLSRSIQQLIKVIIRQITRR